MTAQTFIFVHDEQIVLDYIAANKFNDLPDLKYVFLGQRPTDRIKHLDNVVVARDLPHNIEHLPNLVAWTGWAAVYYNGLITAELVNLFEYDVNVIGKWRQPKREMAYFKHHTTDAVWWNYNGIQPMVERAIRIKQSGYKKNNVPMTSNYTLEKDSVKFFLRDVAMSSFYHEDKNAGHIIERHCSYHFDDVYIHENKLQHLYADSHGTQGRGDRYNQIKSQLL